MLEVLGSAPALDVATVVEVEGVTVSSVRFLPSSAHSRSARSLEGRWMTVANALVEGSVVGGSCRPASARVSSEAGLPAAARAECTGRCRLTTAHEQAAAGQDAVEQGAVRARRTSTRRNRTRGTHLAAGQRLGGRAPTGGDVVRRAGVVLSVVLGHLLDCREFALDQGGVELLEHRRCTQVSAKALASVHSKTAAASRVCTCR